MILVVWTNKLLNNTQYFLHTAYVTPIPFICRSYCSEFCFNGESRFFFFGKDIIFSLEIIQTLRLSKQKKQWNLLCAFQTGRKTELEFKTFNFYRKNFLGCYFKKCFGRFLISMFLWLESVAKKVFQEFFWYIQVYWCIRFYWYIQLFSMVRG